ncbi:MAG: hypothetical protein B6244_05265 [Candidatus Cloacimonetes bacterium 4572_55]|nr:MAG: hypothetical protein B6244_05265 [Candidatus Cloacimonetes bacterium 4572_55]
MNIILISFLFINVLLIFYTYFTYPLLIFFINKFSINKSNGEIRKNSEKKNDYFSVTMIIAAHNEEKVIAGKLENTLNLDYPKERLQIIVATDGCQDRTVNIVKSFNPHGIELAEQKRHVGKTEALNSAVNRATNDIIVFSDANSIYETDAIKKMIRHFGDDQIGCVCGNLTLKSSSEFSTSQSEGIYWRYEKWIKQQESLFSSLIGANGSIFAIRRSLYTPLDPDVIDDFMTPLLIRKKGYRVTYEPQAICYEKAEETTTQNSRRKERIILRQLVALKRYYHVIRPFSGIMGFQIISHKILRWLVPIFMILTLICTLLVLQTVWGILALIPQIIFYSSVGIGYYLGHRGKKSGIFKIPFYFYLMNIASLIAIIRFSRGETQATWKVARE